MLLANHLISCVSAITRVNISAVFPGSNLQIRPVVCVVVILELFNTYPKVIEINGKIIPLRDPAKKFNSLDEFYFWYSSQIGHNPDKHKEVMDILKWGIDNNYINFTLTNFVGNHQWEMLQELKDDPNRLKIANNICLMDD